MTPSLLIRPVLACLAAAALSACGMVEPNPHRFEDMAEAVAAIPLDGPRTVEARPAVLRTADQAGLRPALRVEVMDPHALWDARDGDLGAMAGEQAQRLAAAAAPAVADAVVQRVSARIDGAAARAGLRPARAPAQRSRAAAPSGPARLVQIGAYSSEAAARAAWARLDLDGLTPVFESVEIGGRRLTRLKVRTPAAGAAAVCAAAGVDDPWCRRA
ncbi:SPOR domain-containing protein [Brevundimonas sp.]|uniref:SPOR domain-containing protein n=1 Tax=Brevundimonas sp. TaxID=1871086 RepID=UPI002D660332|nr:SPOR domain-containing protein [Brevundimonas sp.]HYC69429.1 SPOR domain-containing protein [Brevundimonas sp.]